MPKCWHVGKRNCQHVSQVIDMEEKKVTIRLSPEIHKLVRRKMEDDFGRDNFQALLVGYLQRYLAGESAGMAPTASTKTAFDELAEVDPEAAEGLIPFIEIQIEKARKLQIGKPNRVVPEERASARAADRQKKRA